MEEAREMPEKLQSCSCCYHHDHGFLSVQLVEYMVMGPPCGPYVSELDPVYIKVLSTDDHE